MFELWYLLLAAPFLAVYGVFSDRIRGGWPNDKFLDFTGDRFAALAIRSWPFAAIAAVVLWPMSWEYVAIGTFLTFALTCAGMSMSHGPQYDLYKSDPATERTNIFSRITAAIGLKGFWAEFVGLGLTGVLITLPLGLAAIYGGHIMAGVLIALAGFVKSLSYWVAQLTDLKAPFGMAHGNDERGRNPDGGEVLWGLTMPSLAAVILAIL